jgi:hypothetical protein
VRSLRRLPIRFSNSHDIHTVIASQRVGAKRGPMTGSARQSMLQQSKSGLLRFARNDGDLLWAHLRISATQCARMLLDTFALQRGRGECRVPGAPAASCAHGGSEYAHEYSQRGRRDRPTFPTQWFYGLYVISPAIGLSCHRRWQKMTSTNLTPASRRQDHTTSPSARPRPRQGAARVHRIPLQRP